MKFAYIIIVIITIMNFIYDVRFEQLYNKD